METPHFDALLQRLDSAGDVPSLISTFDAIASAFGGNGFVASAYSSGDHSRILLYASTDSPFAHLDRESPWWSDDPIVARLATGAMRPFAYEEAWADPLPSAAPRWDALVAAGFDRGIVFPTSRPPYVGGVLVFTAPGEAAAVRLSDNIALLHLLATYFHSRIVDLSPGEDEVGIIRNSLSTDALTGRRFKLSEREIGCLRWLALGKTARDIADIESLSVHTVRSYLRGAMVKLDASTQAQAIARAVRYGLIKP
ncbi:MAG: autoinducer binding domain-containing protein [Hyphomicrobiales bacterium]|nr:autoinducer binding domain-containing protein [Hyphomicrobiales bacterium]